MNSSNLHNDPRQFASLEELSDAVCDYGRTIGAVFRKAKRWVDRHGIERRSFQCVKMSTRLRPSMGVRVRPSDQTGCKARMHFKRDECGTWVRLSCDVTHNHSLDRIQAALHPQHRRLGLREKAVIERMLQAGCSNRSVALFARQSTKKFVTVRDVQNIRNTMNSSHRNPNYLDNLVSSIDGQATIIRNDNGEITHVIFMTIEQREMCLRYPEVIGMDATYNVCQGGYKLFQLVAVDAGRVGFPVCMGFSLRETSADIGPILRTFMQFAGNIPLRTILMDDCTAAQNAVAEILPTVTVLLCRVHFLRNVKSRIRNFTGDELTRTTLLRQIMIILNTRNYWRYLVALVRFQIRAPEMYSNYLHPQLLMRKEVH